MSRKDIAWVVLGTPLIAVAWLILIGVAIGFLEEFNPKFCQYMAKNQVEYARCGH